jgi:hypothetical protein
MALRIIQWGTGAVGKEVLKGILDPRSGLELAGVRVYSDDKDGVDAGVLVGTDPVGVTASKDGDADTERGTSGVRRRVGLRDDGDAAAGAQPDRLRQLAIRALVVAGSATTGA